jgi:hypothetical protein
MEEYKPFFFWMGVYAVLCTVEKIIFKKDSKHERVDDTCHANEKEA